MKIFDALTLTKSEQNKWTVSRRRGVAPLEMVLVLPLLMMFMGLIVVFGYAASWKIRSEVVARDVGYKIRHPRSGGYTHTSLVDLGGSSFRELHERSPEWPEARDDNERLESHRQGDSGISSYRDHEVVAAPIIRGPVPQITVNNSLLDFTRGVSQGVAEINRPAPIMSEMGRVNFRTPHSFMDNEFQYMRMGWNTPRGQRRGIGNFSRRIPVLWEHELDYLYDNEEISSLIFSINEMRDPVVMAIDEDMDFYVWKKRLQFLTTDDDGNEVKRFVMGEPLPVPPNPGSYRFIRDFSSSPRMRTRDYRLDRNWVFTNIVTPYLDRVVEKPIQLARASQRLYKEVLDHNERELCFPPLSQREIDLLEDWIEQLSEYIARVENR
ncbi:MAG: pilus assembly protein [Mariniblastus sp.]|nr:pilus assembly protein [Mariniblastus sp.]